MSKKRDITLFLQDIIEDIQRIKRFTAHLKSADELQSDDLVFYAVLKALENIGEAVKKIPEDLRNLYAIDWKKITGLRNILTHEYFGVDSEILWQVLKEKLPELEKAVLFLIQIVEK
uniref:DUF86 domain-containing protein n=1 Tax=Pseudothermotoga hypogea TaxID=57487 RepID=A0A832IAN9_9THEM